MWGVDLSKVKSYPCSPPYYTNTGDIKIMGLIVLTDSTVPYKDERIVKKIKEYDECLDVYWNEEHERWALRRRSKNEWHHCFFINNDDGSFRPLDERVLYEIWECDLWRHFGNDETSGGKLHDFIRAKREEADLREKNLRFEYLEWFNKEHKKDWECALENLKSGRLNESPSNITK